MRRKYTNVEHIKRIERQIDQKFLRIRKIHKSIGPLIDKMNELGRLTKEV